MYKHSSYSFIFPNPILVITAFLLVFTTSLNGQISKGDDLLVFKKDINDGLSQNIVISVELNNQGLLWLGTLDGLNVYDGNDFEEVGQYYNLKGPSNDYYEIYPFPDGTICTKRDDGFHTFQLNGKHWEQDSLMKNLNAIYPLDEDVLFMNKDGQFSYYSEKIWSPKQNCFPKGYTRGHILRSTGNTTYALSPRGFIAAYDKDFNCYSTLDISAYASSFVDFEILEDRLWLISNSGDILELSLDLKQITDLKQIFKEFPIERFTDIEIGDGLVYICADQMGLFIYNIQENKWTNKMVHLLDNPQGEHEYLIRLEVDGDRLYFGSTTNGLLIYDKEQINFYNIPELDFFQSTIFDLKLPRKIVEFGNDIWISTTGQGLWRFDKELQEIEHFSLESHPEFLSSNSIRQIAFIDNELWIGYNGFGIEIVDPVGLKRSRKLKLPSDNNRSIIVNDIFEDLQGDIWIATELQGIYIVTNKIVQQLTSKSTGFSLHKVYNIDRINGKMLISNFAGSMYEVDEILNTIKPTNKDLKGFSIKCLLQDDFQNIWIGTGGQGIFLLDKNWNPIDTFSIESGDMLSDEMCILLQDELKNVWAGTNKGLVHFVHNAGLYKQDRIFLQDDGLKSNEFMTGAYLNDSEGNLWMGNIDGINFWKADEIEKSEEQYPIYLKKVYTGKDSQEDIFLNEKIDDFDKRRDLNFDFSTIGFTAQENIKYRVRLVGIEDEWKYLGARKFSNYNNLPSGDYSFQVQATNYDGVWNDDISSWSFSINRRLYEKWWFYLLLLSLVTGLYIYGARIYSNYKLKVAEKKAEQERELLKMEMRALRAQINPHFLFNTLSSINNFILKNEKTIASQFLVKFARLIRLILNYNSKRLISLAEELSALELYIELEQMRLGESFDYFINTQVENSLTGISIPPLILQPFVENAIWHGLMTKEGDQILELDFIQKEDRLEVVIRDNGIGRENASKKQEIVKTRSYGIDITKKRLDLWLNDYSHSATVEIIDLKDSNEMSLGTEVRINMPIVPSTPGIPKV